MRVCAIGDLHGKSIWKKVNPEEWDLIVFIEDYADSFTHSNAEIFHNLKEIIEFKKKYPEKVILLLGNHDAHYLYMYDSAVPVCSGFRSEAAFDLHILLKENKNLFQTAYQIKNYLFTHAGVSDMWYNKHKETIKDFWEQLSDTDDKMGVTLADVLNGLSETRHRGILYEVGEAREGARGNFGGPFWACYKETKMGIIPNYIQICGHTARPKIETISFGKNTKITYIDVLGETNDFYELEIK